MKIARTVILWLGLTLFVISFVILTIIMIQSSIVDYNQALEDDIYGTSGFGFVVFVNIVMVPMPILLSELSLIRNVYVILTPNAPKGRLIRCCVSTALTLVAFFMIVFIQIVEIEYRVGWSLALLSFAIAIVAIFLGIKGTFLKWLTEPDE